MIVTKKYTFREKFSWSLYDWANSVYSLVITTAIFPLYYNGKTRFAPIACSDLTDIIHHVISKNIYSKIIECIGPEIITFKEILQKLLKIIAMKLSKITTILIILIY